MRRLLGLTLLTLGALGIAAAQQGPPSNANPNGTAGFNGSNAGGDGSMPGQSNSVPEINATQAMSALALLSGGILIIRRKK